MINIFNLMKLNWGFSKLRNCVAVAKMVGQSFGLFFFFYGIDAQRIPIHLVVNYWNRIFFITNIFFSTLPNPIFSFVLYIIRRSWIKFIWKFEMGINCTNHCVDIYLSLSLNLGLTWPGLGAMTSFDRSTWIALSLAPFSAFPPNAGRFRARDRGTFLPAFQLGTKTPTPRRLSSWVMDVVKSREMSVAKLGISFPNCLKKRHFSVFGNRIFLFVITKLF